MKTEELELNTVRHRLFTLQEEIKRLDAMCNDMQRQRTRVSAGKYTIGTVIVCIAMFTASTFAGNPTEKGDPRVVEAEQLILKDKDSNVRAKMAVNDDGGAFLTLHDKAGVPRVELSVTTDGSSLLVMAAADRKARVLSRVNAKGKAGIFMYDESGKTLWSALGEKE